MYLLGRSFSNAGESDDQDGFLNSLSRSPHGSERSHQDAFLFSRPQSNVGATGSPNSPRFGSISPIRRQNTIQCHLGEQLDDQGCQIAEVVFDCLKAEGVDLAFLHAGDRSLVLQVERGGILNCVVGRGHQAEFFDRVVPRKELLACISRAHFELRLDAASPYPTLRKLSRNPMHVNNLPIANEVIPLMDKSLVGFKGIVDWEPCFLILCVTFRSRATVDDEGPHPALALKSCRRPPTVCRTLPSNAPDGLAAVLECVYSAGADISGLSADAKVIPLPLNQPIEVGRGCQFEVFGNVLQSAHQLLGMISRRHFRVQVSTGPPPKGVEGAERVELQMDKGRKAWVHVENLSNNAISVDGQILAKDKFRVMAEGAQIAFLCPASNALEMKFLEFRLRRARMVKSIM